MTFAQQKNLNKRNLIQFFSKPPKPIPLMTKRRKSLKLLNYVLLRPSIHPANYFNHLTTSINNSSQPKSHEKRKLRLSKTLHLNTNQPSNLTHHNFFHNRTYSILYPIWSYPNPHFNHYHPMRKSNRTPKCRNLFSILYTSWLYPPPNRPHLYPKLNRNSQLFNPFPYSSPSKLNMIQ